MKFRKKFFTSIFCVFCLILNNPCLEATQGKKVEIFTPKKGTKRQVRSLRTSNFSERLKNVVEQIEKFLNAIDGGEYGEVLRVGGYEIHHLVSSSFCRFNPEIINLNRAPAISIPKNLHVQTGSHGASGYSRLYLKLERFVFYKTNSIRMVWLLGIRDFKRVLEKNRVSPKEIQSEIESSPCKRSLSTAIFASGKKDKTVRRRVSSPVPLIFEESVSLKSDIRDFLNSSDVISIHHSYDSTIAKGSATSLEKLTKSLLDAPHDISRYKDAEQVLDVLIKQFFLKYISSSSFQRQMSPIGVYDV